MKKFPKIKATILSFILGAVIFGGGVAVAAGVMANPATSAVTIDGSSVSLGAYNIASANYFKLRDMAQALDIGLWYDAKNDVIRIETDKKYDANYAGPTSTPTTYSRSNPAPVGTTQTINYSDYLNEYSADVTIKNVIRGSAAWTQIQAANMFNSPAKEGYEYILADVAISIKTVKDDKSVSVSGYMFDVFSSGDTEYADMVLVVEPSPALDGKLYAGASTQGWVVFEVKKDDTAPKCVFEANYDGTGGLWFSLTK